MTHERITLFGAAMAVWLVVLSIATGPLLRRIGLVKPNFRNDSIPVSYGILILFWCAPAFTAIMLLSSTVSVEYLAYTIVSVGMGGLGFLDDLLGDRRRTGLKGHFRAFFVEGEITTGFLKAVGGAAVGLGVTRIVLNQAWADVFLNGAIIALCANALNLLDLRPGRAGAVFLLLAALLILSRWQAPQFPSLAIIFIPALLVYERDARARVMMGDSGSNLLGGTLGLSIVTTLESMAARGIVLLILVLLHIAAERISISKVIENNPLLRRIDRLTGKR